MVTNDNLDPSAPEHVFLTSIKLCNPIKLVPLADDSIGVIAREPIRQGDIVLVEKAVLWGDYDRWPRELLQQIRAQHPFIQRSIAACPSSEKNFAAAAQVLRWLISSSPSEFADPTAPFLMQAIAAYETNYFAHGDLDAMFLYTSRINHSPEPNAEGRWALLHDGEGGIEDPDTPRIALFATRDIAAGEEITMSLVNPQKSGASVWCEGKRMKITSHAEDLLSLEGRERREKRDKWEKRHKEVLRLLLMRIEELEEVEEMEAKMQADKEEREEELCRLFEKVGDLERAKGMGMNMEERREEILRINEMLEKRRIERQVAAKVAAEERAEMEAALEWEEDTEAEAVPGSESESEVMGEAALGWEEEPEPHAEVAAETGTTRAPGSTVGATSTVLAATTKYSTASNFSTATTVYACTTVSSGTTQVEILTVSVPGSTSISSTAAGGPAHDGGWGAFSPEEQKRRKRWAIYNALLIS